jgi:hypothetical protein
VPLHRQMHQQVRTPVSAESQALSRILSTSAIQADCQQSFQYPELVEDLGSSAAACQDSGHIPRDVLHDRAHFGSRYHDPDS